MAEKTLKLWSPEIEKLIADLKNEAKTSELTGKPPRNEYDEAKKRIEAKDSTNTPHKPLQRDIDAMAQYMGVEQSAFGDILYETFEHAFSAKSDIELSATFETTKAIKGAEVFPNKSKASEVVTERTNAFLASDWPDDLSADFLRLRKASNVPDFKTFDANYKHDCRSCKATGSHRCKNCNGHGELTCGGCNATGQHGCTNCKGTAKNKCYNCSGTGWNNLPHTERYGNETRTVYKPVSCGLCYGTGRFGLCHWCRGSLKIRCQTCNGGKYFGCRPCNSTGKIGCTTCQTTGKETSGLRWRLALKVQTVFQNVTEGRLEHLLHRHGGAFFRQSGLKHQRTSLERESSAKASATYGIEGTSARASVRSEDHTWTADKVADDAPPILHFDHSYAMQNFISDEVKSGRYEDLRKRPIGADILDLAVMPDNRREGSPAMRRVTEMIGSSATKKFCEQIAERVDEVLVKGEGARTAGFMLIMFLLGALLQSRLALTGLHDWLGPYGLTYQNQFTLGALAIAGALFAIHMLRKSRRRKARVFALTGSGADGVLRLALQVRKTFLGMVVFIGLGSVVGSVALPVVEQWSPCVQHDYGGRFDLCTVAPDGIFRPFVMLVQGFRLGEHGDLSELSNSWQG